MSEDTPPPPPPPSGGGYGPPPPPSGGGYGAPPPPSGGGYGAPPPAGDYGGGAYGAVPAGNNAKAIWALVLGILSLICCGVAGIPAIILGKMAQNEIDTSGGAQSGRGMATAGFILGIVGLVLVVFVVIVFVTGGFNFSTSP